MINNATFLDFLRLVEESYSMPMTILSYLKGYHSGSVVMGAMSDTQLIKREGAICPLNIA